MKISYKLLVVLVSLAIAVTACGGGGGSDDQVFIDAVAASMRADGDVPAGVDVDCMAAAMVNGLGGAEGLEADYGLTLEDVQNGADIGDDIELSKDAAFSLTEKMWDCDLQEAMVAEIATDMDEDSARCLVGELDQDILRDMFAAELMNPTDAAEVGSAAEAELLPSMFEAMGACDISLDQLGG